MSGHGCINWMVLRRKSHDMDCDKNNVPWPGWVGWGDVTRVGKCSYRDMD